MADHSSCFIIKRNDAMIDIVAIMTMIAVFPKSRCTPVPLRDMNSWIIQYYYLVKITICY
jgi:hypothetical protein